LIKKVCILTKRSDFKANLTYMLLGSNFIISRYWLYQDSVQGLYNTKRCRTLWNHV